MAGNSRRPGAVRKTGTKKAPQVGSGGQRRRSLTGKGPTPKAVDRPGHPAQRGTASKSKQAPGRSGGRPGGRSGGQAGDRAGGRSVDLVFGRNPVVEALEAGTPASVLLVQRSIDSDRRVAAAIALADRAGLTVTEVPKSDLDDRAHGIPHQGIALKTEPYRYSDAKALLRAGAHPAGRILVLDGVTDPRNLGAIIRSARAFGVQGVVLPERRSTGVTPVVWRTSAGAVAHVPVALVTNLTRLIVSAQSAGYLAVGLDASAGQQVAEVPMSNRPVLLVVGGEGRGLGRLVGRTCDVLAGIRMVESADSLNASVAAAIALYELTPWRSGGETGSA